MFPHSSIKYYKALIFFAANTAHSSFPTPDLIHRFLISSCCEHESPLQLTNELL